MIQKARTAHRAAIESMYEDLCTVIERKSVKDEDTKISKLKEVVVHNDVPCKLSFESLKPAEMKESAAERTISTKLFLASEIEISAGSKIIVLHNGEETAYKRSGEPGRFFTHQEIMLELFERWT